MLFLVSQQTSSSRRRAPPPEIYVPPHSGAGDDPFLARWNVSQATFAPIPPNGKSSSSNRPPPLSDNGRRTPSNGTQPSSMQPLSNGRYQPWPAQSNFTSDTEEYPLTTATPGISVLPPVRFFFLLLHKYILKLTPIPHTDRNAPGNPPTIDAKDREEPSNAELCLPAPANAESAQTTLVGAAVEV